MTSRLLVLVLVSFVLNGCIESMRTNQLDVCYNEDFDETTSTVGATVPYTNQELNDTINELKSSSEWRP